MKLTTFQKINLLLISYLVLCLLIEVIVLLIDVFHYLEFEEIKAQNEYDWQSIEWALLLIVGLFVVIIPNTFSILVHDQKSSLNPPINKWSILIKNLPLYFLIILTLAALVTLAFFKDNEIATLFANKIAGNRISYQEKGNLSINLLMFGLFLLFILPVISFYNWLHFIFVILFRKVQKRLS
jgi:hypothetical protein